ncbi:DMT family transporter [Skermanella rosea]|uniref:DMT family transporter n=1 Tax=Skermanella rosea TaxID=1817965 RepID=UPI001E3CF1C5|nr:DMT family transporter [Skermanella rosea]UEM05145.1 DMT family transporter [Skermanella rosea]
MLRLAAAGLFTLMSLFVRLASFEAPVGQIVFYRSAFALVPIVAYLLWRRQFPHGLRTSRPGGHLKRSLFGCTAMFFSFVSLAHLPLALASALAFLAPLLLVPTAMVALKERPGAVVVGAALAGFLGVALMLAPAFEGPSLDSGTLIGVAAGLAMAVTTASAKVQIKVLTGTEPAGTIAFYFAVVCALAGLATFPLGWASPTGAALACLIGAGIAGGLAHIAMTEALARAPASTLAPFEYTSMIWALLFDAAIFGMLPSPLGLAGALVIVASAAVVAFADGIVPGRRAPAATPPAECRSGPGHPPGPARRPGTG